MFTASDSKTSILKYLMSIYIDNAQLPKSATPKSTSCNTHDQISLTHRTGLEIRIFFSFLLARMS